MHKRYFYQKTLTRDHSEGKKLIPNLCWRPLERERTVYKVRRNFKELEL
jgi:hypothetical protein